MTGFQEIFKRIECKYLMNETQYHALRKRLADIAQPDMYGLTLVCNIYLDTPDFFLIRQSMEKPRYKEKIRLRSYGVPEDDSNAFIEIKKKYAGVVYKRRIAVPYRDAQAFACKEAEIPEACVPDPESAQIARELEYFRSFYHDLAPRVVLSYQRIALVGKEDLELRITFDHDLRYRTTDLDLRQGADGQKLMEDGMYLMELKIAGAIPIEIARMLSYLRIWQTSFSKYGKAYEDICLGEANRMQKITDLADYKYKKDAQKKQQTVKVTG